GIRDFHVTGVQTCALPISKSFLVVGQTSRIIRAPACGLTKLLVRARGLPSGLAPAAARAPPKSTPPAARSASRSRLSPGELIARSEEHTSELQSRENLVCR